MPRVTGWHMRLLGFERQNIFELQNHEIRNHNEKINIFFEECF